MISNIFKTITLSIVSLMALSCQETEKIDTRFSVYETVGQMTENLSFASKGGDIKLHLYSGRNWNVQSLQDWISVNPSQGEKGTSHIKVTVTPNSDKAKRVAELNFYASGELVHNVKVEQSGLEEILPDEPSLPIADILDVVFKEDGTAENAATKFGLEVQTYPASELMTYNSTLFNRVVAHYNHAAGKNTASGFYKADYDCNDKLIKALQDGHSMEIVFNSTFAPDGVDELKMFSSHEQGGTGFLISRTNQGNCITFLPNVSTSGKSNWIWTKSGIVPQPGRYYHVIGVWDKNAGKSYIYVDGELKGTANASGSLVLPKNGSHWFGIGADANANNGQGAWAGDIVYAKVYDDVLSADDVKAIYENEKVANPQIFCLQDLQYLSDCYIPSGYMYNIYAKGFKEGDKIEFVAEDGTTTVDCPIVIKDGGAAVRISNQIQSGAYKMFLSRGGVNSPIGPVYMNITAEGQTALHTECVAHRCYHKNGSNDTQFPENSLAAFKRTQDLGVWGAEIDVWITKDDEVVINHNATVPTDSRNRRIEDSYYTDLQDIKLANGENLPTLSSVLEQMKIKPGLKLVLEIKTHSRPLDNERVVDKCIDMVKAAGLENEVVWIAFNYDSCKRIAKKLPDAIVQYLGGDKTPAECFADGIKGIDYEGGRLTDTWIREAHQLGMVVNVWTINDKESMLKFLTKGVDYITTNEPVQLQKLLTQQFITKN